MARRKIHSATVTAAAVTFMSVAVGQTQHDKPLDGGPKAVQSQNIQTVDYLVPHISTVPANAGKRVELFVREKVQKPASSQPPVVLMIAGATVSVVPGFDLQFENYSWMDYLATAGFDVFAMEFTGYGLSPRPMMDNPCNASLSEQQMYLIPNPLAQPCSPAYPFQLTTIQSDWDEIDTVVDYLRRFRNVDRVSLIAWSRGGARAGGYAAHHPEKVERLFLLAPGRYFPLSPSDPPAVLPLPGVPSTVLGTADFHNQWDSQVQCGNQFTPQIRDTITSTMLDFDPLGSTWGTAGVRRAPVWNSPPGFLYWGWNTMLANQVKAPTLIIRGDLDTTVPLGDIQALYADLIAAQQKVFVHVACASHYLVWENQHEVLLRASEEWLRQGTFGGQGNGTFAVVASLTANPNPIPITGSASYGMTTISWNAPDAQIIEIHIGSPNGPLFTVQGNRGTAQTGLWVPDGMTFYLQDVTDGRPLTSDHTLATLVVHLQRAG